MTTTNPYEPSVAPATAPGEQFCYVSTPEHQRTLWGRLVWIYTGSGYLELAGRNLIYTYKHGDVVNIDVAAINKISIGSFSRISKPIRLDYVAVHFSSGSNSEDTILYFTPTGGAMTPVWQTNRIVAEWAERIRAAQNAELTAEGTLDDSGFGTAT